MLRFTCSKSSLLDVVGVAVRAISSRVTMPILSGMSLTAEDGKLSIEATDSEIGIVATIAADVVEAGKLIVPGKFFADTVRVLPDGKVSIEANDNKVEVKSGKTKFSLLNMGKDFPDVFKVKGGTKFSLRNSALKDLIHRTSFACATNDSRPVFCGVLFELDGSKARMVATNTHHLSICEVETGENHENTRVIVPKRALDEVMRVLPENGSVEIALTDGSVSFRVDSFTLTTRLIMGEFPDYNRVFARQLNFQASVSVSDFMEVLNRVGIIARVSSYGSVKLSFDKNEVGISATDSSIGSASESVAMAYDGEPFEVYFNARYLTDVFKILSGEKAILSVANSPETPLIIRDSDCEGDGKDCGFKYIMTPIKKTKT